MRSDSSCWCLQTSERRSLPLAVPTFNPCFLLPISLESHRNYLYTSAFYTFYIFSGDSFLLRVLYYTHFIYLERGDWNCNFNRTCYGMVRSLKSMLTVNCTIKQICRRVFYTRDDLISEDVFNHHVDVDVWNWACLCNNKIWIYRLN